MDAIPRTVRQQPFGDDAVESLAHRRSADFQPPRHFDFADMRTRRNAAGANGIAQRAVGESAERFMRALHRRLGREKIDNGNVLDLVFDAPHS
jgi:hypothetical protein